MLQWGCHILNPRSKYREDEPYHHLYLVTVFNRAGTNEVIAQKAMFMGKIWGPPGSCRPQLGPTLVPWTLLSGGVVTTYTASFYVNRHPSPSRKNILKLFKTLIVFVYLNSKHADIENFPKTYTFWTGSMKRSKRIFHIIWATAIIPATVKSFKTHDCERI